jgi:sugar O-acyltransferase (sialic acid O-acetyltransferase NeuD family)
MDRIVVIGGGGHAKVIISILKKLDNFEIFGYVDKIDKGKILGVKYLGTDEILEDLYKNQSINNAAIGIGQLKDVSLRREIVKRVVNIGYSFPEIISPNAILNEDVEISNGSVVMDGVVITTGTKVGSFSIINTNSSIDHDCNIGNFTHIAPGVTLSGGVKIGNNVLIGTGTNIIQYKEITNDTIVGAGSMVSTNILKPGLYTGVPARFIKK